MSAACGAGGGHRIDAMCPACARRELAQGRALPAWSQGHRAPRLLSHSLMQVERAKLFEGVHHALQHLSDQYLARVYCLASQRLRLEA